MKTWQFINEIAKRKRKKGVSIKSIVDENGIKHENKKDIADCLNNHFSSTGKKLAARFENMSNEDVKDPLDYLPSTMGQGTAFFRNTDFAEIIDIVKKPRD